MKLAAASVVMNTPRERLRYLAKEEDTIRMVPKSQGQQEFERKYTTQIPVLLRRIRRCCPPLIWLEGHQSQGPH